MAQLNLGGSPFEGVQAVRYEGRRERTSYLEEAIVELEICQRRADAETEGVVGGAE